MINRIKPTLLLTTAVTIAVSTISVEAASNLSPYEDPVNLIYSAEFNGKTAGKVRVKELSGRSFTNVRFKKVKPDPKPELKP